jgi:hypothetical protein
MSRHTVIVGATVTPVHYVHFRNVLATHEMSAEGVKVFEEGLDSYGGATLAYVEVEDEGQPTIYAALAQCHEYDRFQKRLGRDHARGRLTQAIVNNFRDGTGQFYTTGIDKIYVLPGPVDVVLRELIEEIEDGTGYLVR